MKEPVSLSPADIGEQLGDAVWEVVTDACGTESGGSSFALLQTSSLQMNM